MADEPATHPPFSFLQKSTRGPKLPPRNPRGGKLARGPFSNPVPAAGSHCPMDMDDDTAERLSRNLPDGPKVPLIPEPFPSLPPLSLASIPCSSSRASFPQWRKRSNSSRWPPDASDHLLAELNAMTEKDA